MASKDIEDGYEDVVYKVEDVDDDEDNDEETNTRTYPCPTCGMKFKELAMCKKHARFCSATEDEPGADWSDERVFLLIDCMRTRYKKFIQMSPKQRKQHWKWVGQIVGASGEDSRIRFSSLTNSYNRVRLAIAQGRQRNTVWRFYSKMDQILGDETVNRAEFVMSSMPLQAKEGGSVQPHTGMVLSTEGEGDGSNSKILDLMEQRYTAKFYEMSNKDRKQFWRDMESELNIPAEEVRIRWNMLTGSFRRAKQTRENFKNRYGREPRSKWRFYDRLERLVGQSLSGKTPLMVLSRQPPPASGFPLATGASLFTASLPQRDPPAGGDATGQKRQGATPDKRKAAASATAQDDTEAFATKRRALFVEDYLREKARREEQRLQLEERRIEVLERLVNVMEGSSSS